MCVFSNGIISALLCMTRLSQHIVVTMKVNCASHWPLSLWRDWICVMHGKYDARLYDYLPGLRWYSLITYSRSSIPALTGLDVQQLFWSRPVRCCLAKRHQQLLTCPKMQYVKILRNLFKNRISIRYVSSNFGCVSAIFQLQNVGMNRVNYHYLLGGLVCSAFVCVCYRWHEKRLCDVYGLSVCVRISSSLCEQIMFQILCTNLDGKFPKESSWDVKDVIFRFRIICIVPNIQTHALGGCIWFDEVLRWMTFTTSCIRDN